MKTIQIMLTIEIPDEMDINDISADEYNGDQVVITFASEPSELPDGFEIGDVSLLSVNDTGKPEMFYICWSIKDFEKQAIDTERSENYDNGGEFEEENPPTIYDRTKFHHALSQMKENHDSDNGITWNTIDYYLDKYCRL